MIFGSPMYCKVWCSRGMEPVRPRYACVPANSTCLLSYSHHHRLVLHHRRLERFVVLSLSSPLSSRLKCHTVPLPSPPDARIARRFDSRHSNVTRDVHDTSPVGPSLGTTYCRTWVLLCIGLFRTPSYVPYLSFANNSRSASLTFLFA